MSALSVTERSAGTGGAATINVRVTDASRGAELVGYLDRLGLRALAGPDGVIRVRGWDDVEFHEARVEILGYIDAWVRRHGVPVQLT
ncbi:MAG TPA: hypothetical protein VJQ85_02045 [Gaiellaceae bacterium]|nr:hypothetical protein [Gaiellaceae bacterium]